MLKLRKFASKRVQICFICTFGLSFSGFTIADCTSQIPKTSPTSRFLIHGNGTATDTKTKLMWMRCSLGKEYENQKCTGEQVWYNWRESLESAETINDSGGYAGFSDWRLPNVKELGSIVERACDTPSINEEVFPDFGTSSWSSTPNSSAENAAWTVGFTSGHIGWSKRTATVEVRLVRNSD